MRTRAIFVVVGILSIGLVAVAQEAASDSSTPASANAASIPRLVQYSGVAADSNAKPWAGTVGITFMLYRPAGRCATVDGNAERAT